jgi:hypothetical protein
LTTSDSEIVIVTSWSHSKKIIYNYIIFIRNFFCWNFFFL